MANDSFVFYRSFYEATKILNDAQVVSFLRILCSYALDGEEPNLDQCDKEVRILYLLIKPQIDANERKREKGKYGILGKEFGERGKMFGKMGGRPPKTPVHMH